MISERGFRRVRLAGVALVAFCGAFGTSRAQDIPGYPQRIDAYDPREIALLPRFCIYTQSFRSKVPGGDDREIVEGWYARLGPGFHALHHYCWGLMKTNRALLLATDQQTRVFYLRDSIGEFDYVIGSVSDDFLLLPEVLAKKGENLIRLGRGAEALGVLERAATLKPDYWPPYAYLSDYYKDVGDLAKARQWLVDGLKYAPASKSLQSRLAQLESQPKESQSKKKGTRVQESAQTSSQN